MITVRVHVSAKKGKQLELMQAISFLRKKIDQESGCASCRVYQHTEDEDEFVIIEEWENEQLARAHLKSENLNVLAGAAAVLTKEVRVALGKDPTGFRLTESYEKMMLK